jgi:hypothetical protein
MEQWTAIENNHAGSNRAGIIAISVGEFAIAGVRINVRDLGLARF